MTTMMEINVACEALDMMRKHNFERECKEKGVRISDQNQCSTCLLSSSAPYKSSCEFLAPLCANPLAKKGRVTLQLTASTCLLCGSPVCRSHSSREFRKESISVCVGCEKFFTNEFILSCMAAPSNNERRKALHRMLDIYDRALILLKHSSKFIDPIANHLEQSTKTQNQVGLARSSAGIVSGVLGVAAVASGPSPVGPSLLLASLVFGGSATAVQAGAEVHNHYSEPNQLANRVLAMNGMLQSIQLTIYTLCDAVYRDDVLADAPNKDKTSFPEALSLALENHHGVILAGLTAGRCAAAGVELSLAEVGGIAESSVRVMGNATTDIARFAGCALSAATLLLETKFLSDTIQQIQAGNPCEKAAMLRSIKNDLEDLPSTVDLNEQCDLYLEGMAQRSRRMAEEEVVRQLIGASRLEDYSRPIASVPEPQDNDVDDDAVSVSSSITTRSGASLLERITRHKQGDSSVSSKSTSTPVSLIERISLRKTLEASDRTIGSASAAEDEVPDQIAMVTRV